MKILTLNTWQERGPWRERWRLILKGLQQYRPDLVMFQEVFNKSWAQKIRMVSGYRYMAFPAKPGGLMLLSQHPVRDWDCITYKTKSPTEDYMRYAMYAKVWVHGHDLALFNTHLSWRTKEKRIREKQVKELLSYINRKAKQLPVFVTGDFNAPPQTPEIRLMRRAKFTDLFKAKKPHVPGLTWDNRNPFAAGSSVRMPNRRIDYIWMRDPNQTFRIRKVEVVYQRPHNRLYPSDHAGVLATLDIEKENL